MESQSSEDLGAELHQVKAVLRHALAEACGTEIRQANTGELQRFEEVLVVASEAASRLVEIRQRAHQDGAPPADVAAPATTPVDERQWGHRLFEDDAGVTWDAFAVYPSAETTAKARLPEPFQHGWLSFDSGLERRRLSPIPADWYSASDEALARMCARAEPAPRRTTSDRQGPPSRET